MSKPEEPSELCPLIESCTELIIEGEYEGCCSCGNWIFCSVAEKKLDLSKYKKTPKEWRNRPVRSARQ